MLQGFNSLIKATSSPITFTDEETITTDNLSYQITDTSKRLWDIQTDVVVKDGGIETTEDYSINYLTGTVTFETATTRTITVSGAFVTASDVASGKSFSFNGVNDVQDSTVFQLQDRTFESGLISATGEIERFFITDSFFIDQLFDGDIKLIEFYPDSDGQPISFYALVSSDEIDVTVGELIMESISFQAVTKFTLGV